LAQGLRAGDAGLKPRHFALFAAFDSVTLT